MTDHKYHKDAGALVNFDEKRKKLVHIIHEIAFPLLWFWIGTDPKRLILPGTTTSKLRYTWCIFLLEQPDLKTMIRLKTL
jgi:hypothetical protein